MMMKDEDAESDRHLSKKFPNTERMRRLDTMYITDI
jgi:hypothetical protein